MLSVEARVLISNERYQDFLREAERERLASSLPVAQPYLKQLRQTVAAWVGGQARRLQTQASLPTCCTPALCC